MGSGASSVASGASDNSSLSSAAKLSQFQRDLRISVQARKYFSDFIMSLQSTEDVLNEIRNTEINFVESLDESFKAGFVKSDIIVVYLQQFLKSLKYQEYCEAQAVSETPRLTRTNSKLEQCPL